jgi:hypothetical protein
VRQSTLARSSSGKELLLSFREFLHALERFLFRNHSALRALNSECGAFSFHSVSIVVTNEECVNSFQTKSPGGMKYL